MYWGRTKLDLITYESTCISAELYHIGSVVSRSAEVLKRNILYWISSELNCIGAKVKSYWISSESNCISSESNRIWIVRELKYSDAEKNPA